jgi:hypothetical protein
MGNGDRFASIGFVFLLTERKRWCAGSGVFQNFSKEDNKEAVFPKAIDNTSLIIILKMLRGNTFCH